MYSRSYMLYNVIEVNNMRDTTQINLFEQDNMQTLTLEITNDQLNQMKIGNIQIEKSDAYFDIINVETVTDNDSLDITCSLVVSIPVTILLDNQSMHVDFDVDVGLLFAVSAYSNNLEVYKVKRLDANVIDNTPVDAYEIDGHTKISFYQDIDFNVDEARGYIDDDIIKHYAKGIGFKFDLYEA